MSITNITTYLGKVDRSSLRSEGANVQQIEQMAHDLYDALVKRHRCTACGGEGLVTTISYDPSEESHENYDLEDCLVTHRCGCTKLVDSILGRYRDEYETLSSLRNRSESDGYPRAKACNDG